VIYLFDEEADGAASWRSASDPLRRPHQPDGDDLARASRAASAPVRPHLGDQIGGQTDAGFAIAVLRGRLPRDTLDRFLPTFIATLAVKPV